MFATLASPVAMLIIALVTFGSIQSAAGVAFTSDIRITTDLTSSQIEAFAPSSKSCANATFPDECTNSTVTAAQLNKAFQYYRVWSLGPKAALTSLMAFESGDFQFNFNHYPGRPGQGTKAMLMFNWIYKYALWAGKEAQMTNILGKPAKGLTAEEILALPDKTQTNILALVLNLTLTFCAAPWYLAKQCEREAFDGLIKNGYDGFKNYIEQCVEAGDITPDRTTKWCSAIKALKPADMDPPTQCSA